MNIAKTCIFVSRNIELGEIFPLSYKIGTFCPVSFCFNIHISIDIFTESYVKNQEQLYNFKWTRTY